MSRLFGVLVTYRRPDALDAALGVLADPAHGLSRLVVVDNAASAETAAVLARHPAPPATLVAAPENLGPAGGIALGMQAVLAEADDDDWVVLLDDDNVKAHAPPLARLHALAVAARAADPAVGMVGATGGRLDRRRGVLVRPADAELAREWVPVDFVAGGQFPVVSVAALRDVGPFRADLFFGFDDLEFGLRLAARGWRALAHGPTWLARRRRFGRLGDAVAPAPRDAAPWRRYYSVRNHIVVLRANGLRAAAVRASAAAAVGRPLADWWRGRPGRWRLARLTWRGVADAWAGRTGRRVEPDAGPAGGDGRVRVVYIAGHGRSGSTVADLLLGRAPGWASCGELRHLPVAVRDGWRCGCGRPLRSCPRWAPVLEKLAADGVDPTGWPAARRRLLRFRRVPQLVWPLLGGPRWRAAVDQHAAATAALYRAVAAVTGATVVVDSSKDPLYGLLLARTPGVELCVLHLVRDPRAVAHSWQRRRRRPEITATEAWMPRHGPAHSAAEWDLRNAMAWVLGRVAGRYRRLRYEDLVADPAPHLAAVLSWAGSPGVVPEPSLPAVNHTVGGNPVRFRPGPLRPDDEWRRALPPGARRLVTALCWPLMRAFGYGR